MKRATVAIFAALALALVVPSLAAAFTPADTFVVNSDGNGHKTAAGAVCEAAGGKCTLRAALEAADANVTPSEIRFGEPFDGTEATAINLENEALPALETPIVIQGSGCDPVSGPALCVRLKNPSTSSAVFTFTSTESEVAELTITGSSVITGFRLGGSKNTVRNNQVLETYVGTEVTGTEDLVIDNKFVDSSVFGFAAVALRGSSNGIYGNLIEGLGIQAITLEFGANANQIGADTADSENVINRTLGNPIFFNSNLNGGSRNEVARNRGTGNDATFIDIGGGNSGVTPPEITGGHQTGASGTATPEAVVRVFEADGDSSNLERFLGEVAAGASGAWTVKFPSIATGAEIVATQTVEGATSEFTGSTAVVADPPSPPPPDNGGGASSTTPQTTPIPTTTTPPPATAPPKPATKPLKCKKGFAKKKVKGKARCVRVKKHKKKTKVH